MRILVANHHRTLVGGIETYLAAVLPRLAAQGQALMFVHEGAPTSEHAAIPLPSGVEMIGLEHELDQTVRRIAAWKPDVAFVHALHVPKFQRAIVARFPTALFAHAYYGLCISGSKTWKQVRPCQKQFDWKCLFYFHAKNCGGSSPVTMIRDYLLHARQLEILKKCEAILTHGGQMQREYIAQGIPADRVLALPHFVEAPTIDAVERRERRTVAKLLFVGRFDELKGGGVLLETLPMIAEKLRRHVELTMIGSGPAGNEWRRIAEGMISENIRVHFPGWLERAEIDRYMVECDLLVVPSVWPEPFGQVGLEAANLGLPAVAFEVGGIPTWLRDGVNGHLAPGDPPTKAGLAEGVAKALENPEHYAKLRAGARQIAKEFSVERHLEALNNVFEMIARNRMI